MACGAPCPMIICLPGSDPAPPLTSYRFVSRRPCRNALNSPSRSASSRPRSWRSASSCPRSCRSASSRPRSDPTSHLMASSSPFALLLAFVVPTVFAAPSREPRALGGAVHELVKCGIGGETDYYRGVTCGLQIPHSSCGGLSGPCNADRIATSKHKDGWDACGDDYKCYCAQYESVARKSQWDSNTYVCKSTEITKDCQSFANKRKDECATRLEARGGTSATLAA